MDQKLWFFFFFLIFVLNLCIVLIVFILLDLFPDFRQLFHLSFLKVLFLAEELYPSPKME